MSMFQHSLECFVRALASIITPDYVEIHLYRRPTGRPSFTARLVGCSLRAPWSGVANSQTDRHRAKVTVGAYICGHVSCRSLFWREIVKIVKITKLFALAVLTCLPLIKTFRISLSKLRGRLFTSFTVYIVFEFMASFFNSCACDRFSSWSCPLNRAVYSTSHSVWSVYRVSRVDLVISTVYPL